MMPAPALVSLVSGLYPALADSPPPGWEQDLAALGNAVENFRQHKVALGVVGCIGY